jgi:hypothetical protein
VDTLPHYQRAAIQAGQSIAYRSRNDAVYVADGELQILRTVFVSGR